MIVNSHIPLNKALLRVGFHFGLSTGDRMFGGRQGAKIAWERPKWRFSYKMPFFDPRYVRRRPPAPALDLTLGFAFAVELLIAFLRMLTWQQIMA